MAVLGRPTLAVENGGGGIPYWTLFHLDPFSQGDAVCAKCFTVIDSLIIIERLEVIGSAKDTPK
jgi:hypothetical protein